MGQSKKSHPARCVVWTDPGAVIPPKLSGVLAARGLPPVHADSPHAALAELCLAERSGVRVALIVDGVTDPARLIAAAERFAPSAVIWIFQPGANPPLRPFVLPQQASPAKAPQQAPEKSPAKAPVKAEVKSAVSSTPVPDVKPLPKAFTPNGHPARAESAEQIRIVRETGLKPDSPQADPIRKSRPVSARDILNDAELEMLLAGERAMEDDPR